MSLLISLLAIGFGVTAAFLQAAFSLLSKNDWGKMDDCEYFRVILRCSGRLALASAITVVALFSLLRTLAILLAANLHLNGIGQDVRFPLLFCWGYWPLWVTLRAFLRVDPELAKNLSQPLSEVREYLFRCLLTELRLRLIILHARTMVGEERLYLLLRYFDENRTEIAVVIGPQVLRANIENHALITRYVMEYRGVRECYKMIGLGKGFMFRLRPVLCQLPMFLIATGLVWFYVMVSPR